MNTSETREFHHFIFHSMFPYKISPMFSPHFHKWFFLFFFSKCLRIFGVRVRVGGAKSIEKLKKFSKRKVLQPKPKPPLISITQVQIETPFYYLSVFRCPIPTKPLNLFSIFKTKLSDQNLN